MNTDIYDGLCRALDLLPGGYPSTKSRTELKILKKIFSPEEALIASSMTGHNESIGTIAQRSGSPEDKVKEMLKAMPRRGIIWGSKGDGELEFRLAPFVVGFYEAQWEIMDHELSHLFEQYWQEGGAEGIMRYDPAVHRVVPAQTAIKTEVILPYDDVRKLIIQAKSFRVIDCICKKQKQLLGAKKCDFPLRVCLTFSAKARQMDSNSISPKEALDLLQKTEEMGLVHTVNNVANGVTYVCNCCGCCCGILRGITEFGIENSVARANYYAVLKDDNCDGCGICEERCQVNACSVDNMATIDSAKCIGCGLCVTTCPVDAIELQLRPDAEIIDPPGNYSEWEQTRLHNRGITSGD
jgi:NAD-dependent dihydropyrimidine dehydrogenase PreA subunit